ncbi:MAG: DUF4286 family protein [Phycisphaerae bacterium]|nr:DUF4286 family protein [Phycisphaerae bacterium]
MTRIAYTVVARLPSLAIRDEYCHWLESGHIDHVLRHGAHSAMIVRLEGQTGEAAQFVEVRYIFPTRQVFDEYLRAHAPALRAEGVRLFGPARGVTFSRTVGEIV